MSDIKDSMLAWVRSDRAVRPSCSHAPEPFGSLRRVHSFLILFCVLFLGGVSGANAEFSPTELNLEITPSSPTAAGSVEVTTSECGATGLLLDIVWPDKGFLDVTVTQLDADVNRLDITYDGFGADVLAGEFYSGSITASDCNNPNFVVGSLSVTVTVLADPAPVCSITAPTAQQTTVSQGSSVSFSGVVSSTFDSNPQLQWTFAGGTPNNSTSGQVDVAYLEPGTFTATLQGTDAQGQQCVASRQVTVDAATPTATIVSPEGNQTINVGESVSFSGQGDSNNPAFAPDFAWDFGDGRTSTAPTPGAIVFDAPGTYAVILVVTDLDNEQSSAPVGVTITVEVPAPGADFLIEQRAPGEIEVQAVVQSVELDYTWDFGEGAVPRTRQGLGEFGPIEVGYTSPGEKTISLRVTDPATGLSSNPSAKTVTVATGSEEVVTKLLRDLLDPADMGQQSIAGSVGSACTIGGMGGDCSALIAAAERGDQETVRRVLKAIEPQDLNAAPDVMIHGGRLQMGLIASRMVALRRATTTGFDISGLNLNIDGTQLSGRHLQSLGSALNSGGAASADASDFGRWGAYISGRYTKGRRDETLNTDGFRYRVNGLTLGADYRVRDNLFLGAALGYTETDTRMSGDGGTLESDGFSGTVYGVWYKDEEFFLDGSVTYGRGDYDQGRKIAYTLPASAPTRQTFDAEFSGSHLGIAVNAGKEMRFGNPRISVTPTARLQYLRAEVDGYREQARSPFQSGAQWALEIEDQKVTSLTSSLGAQMDYVLAQKWGVAIPFVGAEWVHEFKTSQDDVAGWFINDLTRTRFSLPVDDDDSNYFNVTAGVSAQFTHGRSAFISYERILGFSDLRHYSVHAGMRFEF